MAAISSNVNDLLKKTDMAKDLAELERIRKLMEDLSKKQDKLPDEFEKNLEELKIEIEILHKRSSVYVREQLEKMIIPFVAANEAVKDNLIEAFDNITSSFKDLGKDFLENSKQTQKEIEDKLNKVGDFIGEKVNVASQFINKNTLGQVKHMLNFFESKLSVISTNLSSLTGAVKNGFSKLKSILFHPMEVLKSLPQKILSIFSFVINKIKQGIIWAIRSTYTLIVGTIKYALLYTVKILKGITWVVGKVFQGLYFVTKFLVSLVFKAVVKTLSFIMGVLWGAVKTISKYVMIVLYESLKFVAKTVFGVGKFVIKTIITAVITVIASALAPIILMMAAIFLVGWLMSEKFKEYKQDFADFFGVGKEANKGKTGFGKFGDWIFSIYEKIKDFIMGTAKETYEKYSKAFNETKETFGSYSSELVEKMKGSNKELNEGISNVLNSSKDTLDAFAKKAGGGLFREKTPEEKAVDKARVALSNAKNNLEIIRLGGSDQSEDDAMGMIQVANKSLEQAVENLNNVSLEEPKEEEPIWVRVWTILKEKWNEYVWEGGLALGPKLQPIIDYVDDVFKDIKAVGFWQYLVNKMDEGLKSFRDAIFPEYKDKSWTEIFSIFYEDLKQKFLTFIYDPIISFLKTMWDGISKFYISTIDTIKNAIMPIIKYFEKQGWADKGTSSSFREAMVTAKAPAMEIGNKLNDIISERNLSKQQTQDADKFALLQKNEKDPSSLTDDEKVKVAEYSKSSKFFEYEGTSKRLKTSEEFNKSQEERANTSREMPVELGGIVNELIKSRIMQSVLFDVNNNPSFKNMVIASEPEVAAYVAYAYSNIWNKHNFKSNSGQSLFTDIPYVGDDVSGRYLGLYSYLSGNEEKLKDSNSILFKYRNLLGKEDYDSLKTLNSKTFDYGRNIQMLLDDSTNQRDIPILEAGLRHASIDGFFKENYADALDDLNTLTAAMLLLPAAGPVGGTAGRLAMAGFKKFGVQGVLAFMKGLGWATEKGGKALAAWKAANAASEIFGDVGKYYNANSKAVFGFAKGGIIKPADGGHIINVAEAGNPEIVLPLNSEGIKFIGDMANQINPISIESSGNKTDDVLEKIASLIDSKLPNTGSVKTAPADNIRFSDRTQFDIIRHISMGTLSK
jgi:hypothetical protein